MPKQSAITLLSGNSTATVYRAGALSGEAGDADNRASGRVGLLLAL
jgi:hypothetical protein